MVSSIKKPLGIKVISILFFIFSIFLLGIGVLAAIRLDISKFFLPTSGILPGIILVLVAIIFFAMGLGLWKLKHWARIAVSVFVIINTIGALMSILGDQTKSIIHFANWVSIPFLVIWLLILWYLLFSRKIREVFRYHA